MSVGDDDRKYPPAGGPRSARGFFVGVLVVVLTALGWATLAEGALPGRNGNIVAQVFLEHDDGSTCGPEELPCRNDIGRLGLLNPRTKAFRLLPTCSGTECSESDPSWSPDGAKLAFSRPDTGTVWVADADGTNVRYVTPGEDPAWSPDGTRLVVGDRPGARGRTNLFVVNADGTGRRQLTFAGGIEPSWSGTDRIVFSRYIDQRRDSELRTIDPDRNRTRLLVRRAEGKADWSPHAGRVVFRATRESGLWIATSDGKKRRRLTRSRRDREPNWSPNGRTIIFIRSNHLYATSAAAAGGARPRLVSRRLIYDAAWQPRR